MANEPITREEILLNAVATDEGANIKPITREEMFLAKLGGADVTAPTPITRKEQFLQKAIENSGNIGGGGDEGSQLDALIDGSITEITSNVDKITDYAFCGLTRLTTVDFPAAESIGQYAFQNCSNLTTADFPAAKSVGNYAFAQCFNLTAVILRIASVATLQNTNAFMYCYHFHGTTDSTYNPDGLKDGYIYVPAALVEDYKAATNWSTLASQFRALEDYTVDGTTTGALDPNKI